jgi:hypothetical protein
MNTVPQAARSYDLEPCSELRLDLRLRPLAKDRPLALGTPLPVVTVRLEARAGAPIVADWFGFSASSSSDGVDGAAAPGTSAAAGGGAATFRIGCTREPASIALFTPSGCIAVVEGPATVVERSVALRFVELDTAARRQPVAAPATSASAAARQVLSVNDGAWPRWRRHLLQLHNVLHSERLDAQARGRAVTAAAAAAAGGGGGGGDDANDAALTARIGPRVLVCGSRAGSGRTTLCRALVNLAVRDGFQPLLIVAEATGTASVGMPGCLAACYADHGLDPCEGGALCPTVQVPVPLEDCERSKRAEPLQHALHALMDLAEQRTISLAACASGGVIVDTEAVDDFASDDDMQRVAAIVDACNIDTVVVVGSENLRNTLRLRLSTHSAAGAADDEHGDDDEYDDGADRAAAAAAAALTAVETLGAGDRCTVRRDDALIRLINFPAVDGAGDDIHRAPALRALAVQARWAAYFLGSATSPLAAHALRVEHDASRWCVLRALTSSAGGILPLLGAGEEQRSRFRAMAQPIDLAARLAHHRAAAGGGGGGDAAAQRPLVAAVLRCAAVGDDASRAETIGFVAVTAVRDGFVELLAPCAAMPAEPHVFALMHASCQP